VCGPRAVRLDMLERLADLIRPLLAWRGTNGATPPKGAAGDGGFTVIPEMMSLLGCSPDELGGVLKALGFRLDRRPVKTAAATAASPPVPSAANGEATHTDSGTEPAAVEAAPVEAASVEAAPVEVASVEVAPIAAETAASPAEAGAPIEGMVDAAPLETKYEDVWRPRRHQRSERRPDRGQRNRQRSADRAPAAAAQASPEAAAVPSTTPSDQPPMQAREEKPERKEDRRPHGRERGGERDRNREAGQHRRSQQTERRPRRDDRREDTRRKAEVHTAAPPRRGGADPDSPFAALSALRDELAKRGKETST
jgi:ATP-dependent RNA helicase SUPV3L1/SUV3